MAAKVIRSVTAFRKSPGSGQASAWRKEAPLTARIQLVFTGLIERKSMESSLVESSH